MSNDLIAQQGEIESLKFRLASLEQKVKVLFENGIHK
jgi:hypothetical protein